MEFFKSWRFSKSQLPSWYGSLIIPKARRSREYISQIESFIEFKMTPSESINMEIPCMWLPNTALWKECKSTTRRNDRIITQKSQILDLSKFRVELLCKKVKFVDIKYDIKIIMKSKLSKSRRLNSSIISNSSSTSSKQVKLRTIMKGRGSQQSFVDKESIQPSRNSSRINDENHERLSTSLNFNIHIPSRLSHTPNQPTNRNNQYEDTQNC